MDSGSSYHLCGKDAGVNMLKSRALGEYADFGLPIQ